jgi:CO dehydrogenase/acetyl-CoA synthase delta subunit
MKTSLGCPSSWSGLAKQSALVAWLCVVKKKKKRCAGVDVGGVEMDGGSRRKVVVWGGLC